MNSHSPPPLPQKKKLSGGQEQKQLFVAMEFTDQVSTFVELKLLYRKAVCKILILVCHDHFLFPYFFNVQYIFYAFFLTCLFPF